MFPNKRILNYRGDTKVSNIYEVVLSQANKVNTRKIKYSRRSWGVTTIQLEIGTRVHAFNRKFLGY